VLDLSRPLRPGGWSGSRASLIREDSLRHVIAYIRTLAVPGKHVSVMAGKDIYQSFCWVCHGTQGDGNGPAAKNLVDAKPRDFTSKDFIIQGREQKIYRSISLGAAKAFHGSSYMLEWGTALSPQQIRDVTEYLKTFQRSQR
jgi:cytochrome c